MTPTLYLVLITGHGAQRVALAATWAQAQRALAREGAELLAERFGYAPSDDPIVVGQRLDAEGYSAVVREQAVEL